MYRPRIRAPWALAALGCSLGLGACAPDDGAGVTGDDGTGSGHSGTPAMGPMGPPPGGSERADARAPEPALPDPARPDGRTADTVQGDLAGDARTPSDVRPPDARPADARPADAATGSLPAGECRAPCTEASALVIEKQRLRAIGGNFLGICGDANHTYGFHVPAYRLPATDYSMRGEANRPVCQYHAAAIDIGMNWPAARAWLRWLIQEIRARRLTGIAEVIGSYDGRNVRYWSERNGWPTEGVAYTGVGHDTWSHISIYRSTALVDHRILAGWTATGGP
jgi:hypothetical protein